MNDSFTTALRNTLVIGILEHLKSSMVTVCRLRMTNERGYHWAAWTQWRWWGPWEAGVTRQHLTDKVKLGVVTIMGSMFRAVIDLVFECVKEFKTNSYYFYKIGSSLRHLFFFAIRRYLKNDIYFINLSTIKSL